MDEIKQNYITIFLPRWVIDNVKKLIKSIVFFLLFSAISPIIDTDTLKTTFSTN